MQFANQPIWSPFSTQLFTSQFDQSNQTYFQFSSTVEVIKPIDSVSRKNIPKPISRPKPRDINQLSLVKNIKRSLPKRSLSVDMSEYLSKDNRSKICSFCRANGEDEIIYRSHGLITPDNKISCPILMKNKQKKQKMNLLNSLISSRL